MSSRPRPRALLRCRCRRQGRMALQDTRAYRDFPAAARTVSPTHRPRGRALSRPSQATVPRECTARRFHESPRRSCGYIRGRVRRRKTEGQKALLFSARGRTKAAARCQAPCLRGSFVPRRKSRPSFARSSRFGTRRSFLTRAAHRRARSLADTTRRPTPSPPPVRSRLPRRGISPNLVYITT